MKKITILIPLCLLLFFCQLIHAQDTEETRKDYTELGWELLEKENFGSLRLGMPLSVLLTVLGAPDEKEEAVEWGADGEIHQNYIYRNYGLKLDIIGEKDQDKKLNMILATAPCFFKTSKGIGIGSIAEEVVKAYQEYLEPGFWNINYIVAGSVYGGIILTAEDGKISQIFFGAAAD